MKKCSCCGRPFPVERFSKHPHTIDGLQSQSKDCINEKKETAKRIKGANGSIFQTLKISNYMTIEKMIIKQSEYPQLEIDNTQKDHVQIWNDEADPQVIHIERDKIENVIVALRACGIIDS